MTPVFWHTVATKIKPFKRKLAFGAAIGLTGDAVSFSSLLQFDQGQQVDAWLPLCLLLSTIVVFWCLGLLQLIGRYGTLPVKSKGLLGGANYYWNFLSGWFGAWFLTIWFLLLAFTTIASPFILIYSNAR